MPDPSPPTSCPRCSGQGGFAGPGGPHRCPDCNGTGARSDPPETDRERCGGSGHIPDQPTGEGEGDDMYEVPGSRLREITAAREAAEARAETSEASLSTLKDALERALDEFVGHQSWRCSHPDRYPLDEVDPPDCYCGLHQFTLQARALLSPEESDRA